MNTEKILELASLLEKVEPTTFHMSSWFAELVPADEVGDEEVLHFFNEDELVPRYFTAGSVDMNKIIDIGNSADNTLALSCGTTACIAGWAIANEYFNGNKKPYEDYSEWASGIITIASDILGITVSQGERLFFCNTESIWIEHEDDYDYGSRFNEDVPETWNIHPKIAADMLRRIASGEVQL